MCWHHQITNQAPQRGTYHPKLGRNQPVWERPVDDEILCFEHQELHVHILLCYIRLERMDSQPESLAETVTPQMHWRVRAFRAIQQKQLMPRVSVLTPAGCCWCCSRPVLKVQVVVARFLELDWTLLQ